MFHQLIRPLFVYKVFLGATVNAQYSTGAGAPGTPSTSFKYFLPSLRQLKPNLTFAQRENSVNFLCRRTFFIGIWNHVVVISTDNLCNAFSFQDRQATSAELPAKRPSNSASHVERSGNRFRGRESSWLNQRRHCHRDRESERAQRVLRRGVDDGKPGSLGAAIHDDDDGRPRAPAARLRHRSRRDEPCCEPA